MRREALLPKNVLAETWVGSAETFPADGRMGLSLYALKMVLLRLLRCRGSSKGFDVVAAYAVELGF